MASSATCSICGESTSSLVQHVMYHFNTTVEKCRNCDSVFGDFEEYKLHRKCQCSNHSNYPNFKVNILKCNEQLNCSINQTPTWIAANNSNSVRSLLGRTVAEELLNCKKIIRDFTESFKSAQQAQVPKKSGRPKLSYCRSPEKLSVHRKIIKDTKKSFKFGHHPKVSRTLRTRTFCNGSSSEEITREINENLNCFDSECEPMFIANDQLPWSDQDPLSSDDEDFFIIGLNGCRLPKGDNKPLEKRKFYLCEICGKTYKMAQNLKEHWYKHKNVYSCETCKKSFSTRAKLEMHIQRDHIYSSDHICEVCGKKFCHEKFLQQHVKRHQKLLKYPCEVCKKCFFDSYALKSHMRQHTDEKPFRCSCGEAFKHNVLLKAHKKSKHGITEEKTIPCSICNEMFGSKSAIYAHMRKHNK